MRSFPAPTRRSVVGLLLTLWHISNTAARTFVWGTVREGAIDLRSYGRAQRLLAVGGLLLIAAFLLGILFNDVLRFNGPLELLANESTATRGLLVPSAATPITMAALALGWGSILAGALHTRPALRWACALIYVVFGLLPLISKIGPLSDGLAIVIVPALVLGLLIAFIVLPRVNLPLALEWSIVLALHGGLVIMHLLTTARFQRLTDDPWVNNLLSSLIQSGFVFTTPFLVISGLGWVDFGLEASGWAARAVRRHAGPALTTLLLLALLGYRLYGLAAGAAEGGAEELGAWGGAALFCAGLVPIALWRLREREGGAIPRRLLIALAALLPGVQILLIFALEVSTLALLLQPFDPSLLSQQNRISSVITAISNAEPEHRALGVALAGLALAWAGRRRGAASLTAFGLVLAWSQLLAWLTREGRPLAALQFEYVHVDAVLLVALSGLALLWLAHRRLTPERALRLLAVALLLALLNQTEFLDNPFSPLFGFAGVFFLVFGIAWNVLTAGGSLVNGDSPGLPRDSRLLLYLGYVLLSVSVAHWYLVSHNLEAQINQNTINQLGFLTLGLPLAYLMVVEGGAPLLADEDAPADA